MSETELEQLELEEQELEAKILALRAKKKEIKDAEERSRPISIKVMSLTGGSLLIESEYRHDVVEYFKTIPGRMFRGYSNEYNRDAPKLGKNLIPIAEWKKAEETLTQEFNGVTITWTLGVKEEMEWYTTAPPWEVIVHPSRRHFLAKVGPRQSGYRLLSSIPGADWDEASRSWKTPLTEGWRLYKKLEGVEGVVYAEDAKEIIFEQVKRRAELDIIARKEDSDFTVRLTRPIKVRGHEELIPWHYAMKPFQRVGVEFGFKSGGRFLDGDDTGLGKTWVGLAIAELYRMDKAALLDGMTFPPEELDDEDKKIQEAFLAQAKFGPHQTLCVVKAANIPNWIIEIKNLTGEDAVVCVGGKPDFFVLQEIVMKRVPYVIISYDTLGAGEVIVEEGDDGVKDTVAFPWVTIFQQSKPDLLILDEAHQIKTPDARRSKAAMLLVDIPHVIPMTASPVLNRTEELWTLLYMLDPEMFKVHDHFVNTYTVNGMYARNTKELHELMRPMFLRRRKKDVIKDLPPINRITRYHKLSKQGADDYKLILDGIYRMLKEYDPKGFGGQEISIISILAKITRLKQVCAADTVDYTAEIAQELIEEHAENGGGKVLIFSQFKGTAYAIARALGHEAVCTVKRTPTDFVSLDATKRHELFENTRNDPSIKYVVTTEAAKEGHNLEFCNWVIFNDLFWTPAGHMQCEGRAYGRLSDPHPIDSIYVVVDVEIVRWINDLLDKKTGIIEEAVEGIEGSRESDASVGGELIRRMKESMYTRSGR